MASKNRRKHARYVEHIAESGPVEKVTPDYVTGGYVDTPEYREMIESMKESWKQLSPEELEVVGQPEDYDWEHPIERVMPEPEIEGGEVQPPVTEEG